MASKCLDDLLLVMWISRFTLTLTLCTCHFGDANDVLAFAYLQSIIQSEQKVLVPSPSGRLNRKVKFGKDVRPRKAFNNHGTAWVKTIIVMLPSIININSGVSYPNIRSSIPYMMIYACIGYLYGY